MTDHVFIVITKNGYERTHKTPNFRLNAGERAFRLDIEVPEEAFSPPKLPVVKMTIPKEALIYEIEAVTEE